MNRYLLLMKLRGDVFVTVHDSQHSMSREVNLVEKENGIKINLLASAVLDEQCLIDEYPDNTAFAVTMGIDAAVIPMTDAEIRQHDRESIAAWNKEKNCEEVESYVSPFDGRQK